MIFLRRTLVALLMFPLLADVLAQTASHSGGASLFVAPWGSDSNQGTIAKPFATFAGARAAVRAMRSRGLPSGGVTVWVRNGLYLLDQSFLLEAQDSGEDGKPVAYRAMPNEHPRLFGGARLDPSAFARVTDPVLLARMAPEARGHIVQFTLSSGIARPARYPDIFKGNGGMFQLIRNRAIMPLSRWPNQNYTAMASVTDSGITPPHGGTFH